jgi:hypothetical protein
VYCYAFLHVLKRDTCIKHEKTFLVYVCRRRPQLTDFSFFLQFGVNGNALRKCQFSVFFEISVFFSLNGSHPCACVLAWYAKMPWLEPWVQGALGGTFLGKKGVTSGPKEYGIQDLMILILFSGKMRLTQYLQATKKAKKLVWEAKNVYRPNPLRIKNANLGTRFKQLWKHKVSIYKEPLHFEPEFIKEQGESEWLCWIIYRGGGHYNYIS